MARKQAAASAPRLAVGKHTSTGFSAQFPAFCSCAPFRARTFTIRIRRHRLVGAVDRATPRHRSMASESDTETLPLQGDVAARSGRRASRVLATAAAATLVVLSALAYSSTVPRAVRRGAFSASAPLGGTSGTYGWSCKDCSGGAAGSLTWSCNCRDKSQVYRGTSTVLKWTCQKGTDVDASDADTELWNDNGCLQCKAYNDAWDDAKLVVGLEDLCMAASPDWIASLFKPQSLKSD